MKSDYANLTDDLVEVLHNPNISKNCFLVRLKNIHGERYEMMISKDDMVRLTYLFGKFVEQA
jgi:hypothetical protein